MFHLKGTEKKQKMETKTYTVNKVKQLVDLNGSSVNFDVNFRVTSKDGKPFQMLVVDQTTLDNNPNLEYKNVTEGQISGNVRSDKNVYQNHFLVLKADNPTMCEVELQKTELPKMIQPPMEIVQPVTKTETNWKKILIIGCIIALGAYGIYVFFYKENKEEYEEEGEERPQFVFYSPKGSPVQSAANSRSVSAEVPAVSNPLLERLKKLDLN